jgi:hypothetical protein
MGKITQNTKWGPSLNLEPLLFISVEKGERERLLKVETLIALNLNFEKVCLKIHGIPYTPAKIFVLKIVT